MEQRKIPDALRACVAGLGAVGARSAAVTVFQTAGRHLLDQGARDAARKVVDVAARAAFGAMLPPGLGQLAGQGAGQVVRAAQALGGARLAGAASAVLDSKPVAGAIERLSDAAQGAASRTIEQAADHLAPGLRRSALDVFRAASAADRLVIAARSAAVVGAVIDGVHGGVHAAQGYQQGQLTARQAAVRVAIGAGTGAASAASGVALGAAAVALLGGLSAPALFVVGAAGSIGAKRALRWAFDEPS